MHQGDRWSLMQQHLEENLHIARQVMQLRHRLDMRPEMISKLIELEQEKDRTGFPAGGNWQQPQMLTKPLREVSFAGDCINVIVRSLEQAEP